MGRPVIEVSRDLVGIADLVRDKDAGAAGLQVEDILHARRIPAEVDTVIVTGSCIVNRWIARWHASLLERHADPVAAGRDDVARAIRDLELHRHSATALHLSRHVVVQRREEAIEVVDDLGIGIAVGARLVCSVVHGTAVVHGVNSNRDVRATVPRAANGHRGRAALGHGNGVTHVVAHCGHVHAPNFRHIQEEVCGHGHGVSRTVVVIGNVEGLPEARPCTRHPTTWPNSASKPLQSMSGGLLVGVSDTNE